MLDQKDQLKTKSWVRMSNRTTLLILVLAGCIIYRRLKQSYFCCFPSGKYWL